MQQISAWSYISLIILLILSAFFNSTEIAYSAANGLRLKKSAENSNTLTARLAYFIYERFDRTLTTTLIGNNIVSMASASLATVIVLALLGERFSWVSTVAMTVIALIFCEITPKMIASRLPDATAAFVSIPMRVVMFVTYPLVLVISWLLVLVSKLWKSRVPLGPTITEDDLESIIETVEDEGVIDEDSSELLQSALDFEDVRAYEVLTPRVDMLAIDIEDSNDEILEKVMDSPYSRIPVYEGTIDNIIGILHLNHLFKELIDKKNPDIKQLLLPVTFVHKTMPLNVAFAVMKRKQCHMVIVNDEYGGTMGLLTMEDILEQLVGDIWDESDEIEEEFEEIAPDLYECEGDMRIYDFFDELDIDDRDYDDENATVGGWAMDILGGYPQEGSTFEYKNLTVTVKEMNGRRIETLSVRVHEPHQEDEMD